MSCNLRWLPQRISTPSLLWRNGLVHLMGTRWWAAPPPAGRLRGAVCPTHHSPVVNLTSVHKFMNMQDEKPCGNRSADSYLRTAIIPVAHYTDWALCSWVWDGHVIGLARSFIRHGRGIRAGSHGTHFPATARPTRRIQASSSWLIGPSRRASSACSICAAFAGPVKHTSTSGRANTKR